MGVEDTEILLFVEDLFEACLSINFQVTYVPFRQRATNASKHISANAVAAINDVVKCFLAKFAEHIKDIIRIIHRLNHRDVFFTLLGEFYLLESEFSWSKLRKYLGIACAVATSCYIENKKYITTDILINIVVFLESKRFGNLEKFIGCQAFEQNCEDYSSRNVYERMVCDIKHLNGLKKELPHTLQEFTYNTSLSRIFNSEQSDAASSSQSSSVLSDSSFQLQSCVSINSSSLHASNQATRCIVGDDGLEQSTVNRYDTVAGASGTEGGHISQHCNINNLLSCGIADNMTYNEVQSVSNQATQFTVGSDSSEQTTVNIYETVVRPSGAEGDHIPQLYYINNPVSSGIADNMTYNEVQSLLNYLMPFEAEDTHIEQFIFSEVSELEYLIKLSLKTIDLIKKNSKTVSSKK